MLLLWNIVIGRWYNVANKVADCGLVARGSNLIIGWELSPPLPFHISLHFAGYRELLRLL